MTNKEFKGEIKTFGAVLILRYEKIDMNNSFNVFDKRRINYTSKEVKNAEDVLMLVQYLKGPKYFFDYKKNQRA